MHITGYLIFTGQGGNCYVLRIACYICRDSKEYNTNGVYILSFSRLLRKAMRYYYLVLCTIGTECHVAKMEDKYNHARNNCLKILIK